MKFLQLNIWGGRLGEQIASLLKRENADVVCLQEAMYFEGGRTFLFDDIQSIAKNAGYKYVEFSPHLGYQHMKRTAKMGLVTLSKVPFEQSTIIPIRLSYTNNFDFLDTDYNVQSLLHVTLTHSNRTYHVLNYHGYHVRDHKSGTDENFRQCEVILDYVSNLDGNVVLCGDFNLAPESSSIQSLNASLRNLIIEHDVVTTRTNLTSKTGVCDYIFVSNSLECKSFSVLNDVVSDHRALVLEI